MVGHHFSVKPKKRAASRKDGDPGQETIAPSPLANCRVAQRRNGKKFSTCWCRLSDRNGGYTRILNWENAKATPCEMCILSCESVSRGKNRCS